MREVRETRSGSERLVLLPEASVFWTHDGKHSTVTVDRASITTVHALQIDEVLCLLRDNGDLQGKLFLA